MNDAAAPPSRRRRFRELRVIVLAGLLSLLGLVSAAPALATTYTVTNLDDAGQGSLRQALTQANNDPTPPATVTFAPGVSGTIDLLTTLPITQSVTVDGPGASALELDGNGGQVQIMTISSSSTVSISGLTFAFGAVSIPGGTSGTAMGGAIDSSGALTLSDDEFDHNSAGYGLGSYPQEGMGYGGAVYNSGRLTVIDSTFAYNTAGGAGGSGQTSGWGRGGAIYATGTPGSLVVRGSSFVGNSAGGHGGAGNLSGFGFGGAIWDDTSGALTLTDSTLTANTAGGAAGTGSQSGIGEGGAIVIGDGGPTELTFDTIDANAVGPVQGSVGAGIEKAFGSATVVGTIVSGNTGADNCSGGGLSATDSLEGPAGQTSCGFDLPSADPLLGALADNGGPTQTQAPGAGSPAIRAVALASDCSATDQRGALRPWGGCDVGAYEVASPAIGAANASSVTTTSAALTGSVANPDVRAGTVSFQYGTSAAYASTTASQALPAGAAPSAYSVSLSGLAPGTIYHYRVVATNPDGTVYGSDQQFTTGSLPGSLAGSLPGSSPIPPPSSQPSNIFTFGKASVAPGGKITLPVHAPDAGRFVAKATFKVRSTVITYKHGRRVVKHVTKTFTYGTASVTSPGVGTFKLVMGVSARAEHELKLLGSRQVTIAVTFTPTGGTTHRASKKARVKRSRKGKYS